MSNDSKLPKTNSSLPSINYKHFISLVILLLVTSSTTQSPSAKYDCPKACKCNEAKFSARCEDLDQLIESYSRKQHNFMPIKSLDLSNNQLTKLTNQLELLVNLTELDLSNNQLTRVHKLNFESLERLDLSNNRITSAKLKRLPKHVIHLNLAHNKITYLPEHFRKLKNIRSLELAGNPLNCTCETLLVRDWIAYKHVYSEKPILCSSPVAVKGQPWLQARAREMCDETSSTTTQRSKYNWDNLEDDNEIMMGDQPQEDQSKTEDIEYEDEEQDDEGTKAEDEEVKADEEETKADEEETKADEEETKTDEEEKTEMKDVFADVEKTEEKEEEDDVEKEKSEDDLTIDEDLMPVSQEHSHEVSTAESEIVDKISGELNEEGSGDENVVAVSEEPEDEESGSGILAILPNREDEESSSDIIIPVTEIGKMGIFEDFTEAPINAQGSMLTNSEVESNGVNPALKSDQIQKASSEDNTGTYILLGILALCLVSLMIFVAMKNRKEKNRNRRYDVEKTGATELQDMDKRLLGKPMDKNGNGNGNGKAEQSPLINDYPHNNGDKPNAYTAPPSIKVEQPKAAPRENARSQNNLYENPPLTNGNGHAEPIHSANGSTTRLPDSDEEVFHPAESLNVSPEVPKRYSPIYTPASPRSERYSPVYSPETGRVKIKLTETPKPKTPVVVTRSRSRAGEYINTPN